MNDRELLELAAKAAEVAYLRYVYESYPNRAGILYGNPNGQMFIWNPLEDDGDALRLATKLKIRCGRDDVFAFADWWMSDGVTLQSHSELCGNDHYAATRRAITRAAAEIGARGEKGQS